MFPNAHVAAFELGFTPAAAAILSLGPQNTLLLRESLSGRKALIVLATCYGCELGFVLLGTLGLGAVAAARPVVTLLLWSAGAAYLLVMSARCFARAFRRERAGPDGRCGRGSRLFVTALTVSLFNPLAWIESVLVLGALSATVPYDRVLVFAVGAALGGLCRLSALGLGARMLRPMLRMPSFRRAFDTLAGLVMGGMAVVLLRGVLA